MGPPERRSNSVAVAALRIKIQPRVKNAQKNIFFAMRLMEIRVSGFSDSFGLCRLVLTMVSHGFMSYLPTLSSSGKYKRDGEGNTPRHKLANHDA